MRYLPDSFHHFISECRNFDIHSGGNAEHFGHALQRTGYELLPVINNGCMIAYLFNLVQKMRGHEDGHALSCNSIDEIPYLHHAYGVQSEAGLVRDHKLRVAEQRLHSSQPLRHALAALADEVPSLTLRQTISRSQGICSFLALSVMP